MEQLGVSLLSYFSLFITNSVGSANVHVNHTFVIDESDHVRIDHDFSIGFTHVLNDNDYRNRSILSYHYYYCTILSIVPVPGNSTIPLFDRVLCGLAFLTEFDGCNNSPSCDEQFGLDLGAANAFLQLWEFWGDFYYD
ncbi:unnamed protein product [Rotaria sp. Silwood1]|nr:unnamed protein product [Rotaria sp. Silwood1]CAF0843915.1 unnamed protein product [Rotaria sp. Silwood1]